MKKILFLSIAVIAMVGCSKSDEEQVQPKYLSLDVTVESTKYYSTEKEPSIIDAIIEIYEGDNIEKKDISIDGFAFDKSSNTNVQALFTASNSYHLNFDKAEIGKSYFIFIKHNDSGSQSYKNGAYSYTTVKASGNEGDVINIKKIFSNNARPNEYEELNYDITKSNSDFYVARFRDTKEYVRGKEMGAPSYSGGTYDKYYLDKYTNKYYYYSSGVFYKGITKLSYQYSSQFPQLILTCLGDYRKAITELKEQYGNPVDYNVDIYSFNNSSSDYTQNDDFKIGQEVMNGFKAFYYTFKDDRKIIKCQLSEFNDGIKTQVWAYTITTTYEENK